MCRRQALPLSILAFALLCALILFRQGPVTSPAPECLRVVTANILFTNERKSELTSALSDLDADVVVLQEWTGANADRDEFTRRGYTLRANAPRQGTAGSCLFHKDRYEVVAATVASPIDGPCAMPLVTARVRLGARWLSIVGVHAPPPIASCEDGNRRFLAAIAGWIDAGKLRIDVGAARAGDPVLLVGDLNARPGSASVSALRATSLRDAAAGLHLRPQATWRPTRWLPALLRLDYILYGDDLGREGVDTIAIPGSDHRAVMADFRWDD